MNFELSNYIQKHKNIDREVHYTHVSCIRPMGRFGFGRKQMEGFWDIYCRLLDKDPDMISGMAEKPQEYSMLVLDADIKKKISDVLKSNPEIAIETKDENNKPAIKYKPIVLYNDKHIKEVINCYQEVIQSVTKDWKPEHSTCVLLEKPPYIVNGDTIKSGFHLAFINYFCNKSLEDTYLIPKVVIKVNERNIFKDIGFSDSSKILDIGKKNQEPKPWLLYGSRKSESSKTYTATRAFLHDAKEVTLQKVFENYKIYDEFNDEIKYNTFDDLKYLFPRVFSVNPCSRETVDIYPAFDATANLHFADEKVDKDDVKYDQTHEQQMETAARLIEMLDPSRAEEHDKWIEIGWILYNISEGGEDGLEQWILFSQMCQDKFSPEICFQKWSRMYKRNYTLGTLKHYAKIDSPKEYEEFRQERLHKMIRKAIQGSHNDLAKALYESYSNEFVCASLKPEMWFYYTNHHWEPMEEGVDLRKKISTDLVQKYAAMAKEEVSDYADTDDNDTEENEKKRNRVTTIFKLINNLKNSSFKNSIMKECREVFYDRNFLKLLGKNKYLLALQNGVYDLQSHTFRDGNPEDYIAFQMPIAYREFNELDEWVIEVYNFFQKIFPDNSIREYILDRCAEMLVGGNKRKHVYFWTGRGNNGKSVMKSLIQKMFGEYFIDIPNSVLVGQKPKSGQACPELARADRGVRAAFTQEPNKKDLVNTGALKEYSGNDTFYARTLFEKGGEIDPMFKLCMICNDLPGVTTNDPAVWNRLRVIPFESTFTDNPPADEEEQFRTKTFLKDENFDEKLPKMLEPLFWILTRRLPKIKTVIYEPYRVKEATDKYRRSQDVYAQFIDERMIPDESKYVNVMDFFQVFREWHKQAFPGVNIPNRNDCADYLTDVWGQPNNYRWKGYRIRTERDDVEEGRANESNSVDYSKITSTANPLL